MTGCKADRGIAGLVAALLALALQAGPAEAETEDAALGSLRLRGGIDANPRLLPGGRASGFAAMDGAFAIGRQAGDLKIGLIGEVERTEFTVRGLAPSERYRLALEAESTAVPNWSLRSGTRVESERSATLQALDATQSLRVQWTGGVVRPFLMAEAGYHTLNETNAILTDFLPEPQRFARAALTPGVTVQTRDGAFGASVRAQATRYADAVDLFGYRRANERIEPFLFARYEAQGLSVSASVSHLFGFWRDVDFSRVSETLFDASLTKSMGRFALDLSASRFAGETSFPISPVTITDSYSASLTFRPDETWTLSALARSLRTRYLDSPFSAETFAYGVAASHALPGGWVVGAEMLRIDAVAINRERADGGIAMLSLARRLAAGGPVGRRAPDWTAPAASRSSPQSLKSPSLSGASPFGRRYQPP